MSSIILLDETKRRVLNLSTTNLGNVPGFDPDGSVVLPFDYTLPETEEWLAPMIDEFLAAGTEILYCRDDFRILDPPCCHDDRPDRNYGAKVLSGWEVFDPWGPTCRQDGRIPTTLATCKIASEDDPCPAHERAEVVGPT